MSTPAAAWARHARAKRQLAAPLPVALTLRGEGMAQQPPATRSRPLIFCALAGAVVTTGLTLVFLLVWVARVVILYYHPAPRD